MQADRLDFGGRVAIVTGAARGLGRDYALRLAARGARVVVNDVSVADIDALAEEINRSGGTAIADHHDVSQSAGPVVDAAMAAFGRLDILINNAGIVRFRHFADQDPAEWWRIFDIHVRGTVEMTRAAWPHLIASGTGCIVNIASSAMLSEPGISAYSAAKGAIWGLSNTLADEGARVGIRVHAITPTGWTPSLEDSTWDAEVEATLRGRFTAQRVADFVTWLVHQDTPLNADTKTFWVGGGHAGRVGFCALPSVQPGGEGPEGWAAVADRLLEDAAPTDHFWNEGQMVTYKLLTANPALAPRLAALSPTGGAGDVADRVTV